MENLKAKVVLNIEIANSDLLIEMNTISMELSLSFEEFILYSISKLLSDVKFVRQLRVANKNQIKL